MATLLEGRDGAREDEVQSIYEVRHHQVDAHQVFTKQTSGVLNDLCQNMALACLDHMTNSTVSCDNHYCKGNVVRSCTTDPDITTQSV